MGKEWHKWVREVIRYIFRLSDTFYISACLKLLSTIKGVHGGEGCQSLMWSALHHLPAQRRTFKVFHSVKVQSAQTSLTSVVRTVENVLFQAICFQQLSL